MLKKTSLSAVIFLLTGLLLAGCAKTPSAETQVTTPAPKIGSPAPKAGWEQKWEKHLVEARKEGRVSIYANWIPENREALSRTFKEKYGIDLEFTIFGRGAEIPVRVQAENRAGLYLADLFGAGTSIHVVTMKPHGLIGPLRPLLLLPEVLGEKAWRGGKLPLLDSDETTMAVTGRAMRTVVYNSTLVKDGEITSLKDLLKPQYKGRITLNDPTVSGTSQFLFAHLGLNLWGEAEATDFLRKLLKEQAVDIQRDVRLHLDTVAKGKYAIGLGADARPVAMLFAAGVPIKVAMLKEDNFISAGGGAFSLAAKLAHPNATVIFVNWLLTKEGQSVYAESSGMPSTRVDASVKGIDPVFIPVPGEKHYSDTQEFLAALPRWDEIIKKIVEETRR